MNLLERVEAIAKSAQGFRWLGEITPQLLSNWVTRELGVEFATSSWAPYGSRFRQMLLCTPILHIVAGETSHAALQSLMRGILVGAENWIKLPSNDLVEVRSFVQSLPKELQPSLSQQLLPGWLEKAAAVVVFGSDRTIQEFAGRLQPWQRFIPHGHKISFAMILGEWTKTEVTGAIRDGSAFDQLGCLSPQFFLVKERADRFAEQLAAQLESSAQIQLSPAAAAAIRAFREDWRFRNANNPAIQLWESRADSLNWTVLLDPGETIPDHPLHRTFVVKPLTATLERTIGRLQKYISTIGIHPVVPESIDLAVRIGAQRICPIGQMQVPALDWHHDGFPSLSSLVRVIDLEPRIETNAR
jgi:hypothetical protein